MIASRNPKDFQDKPVVSNVIPHFKYPEEWWPVLAPEIIVDGDKMYIAYFMNHHMHPIGTLKQGGVFLPEITWNKMEVK